MKPVSEEELIAFHLGEMSFLESERIARQIEMHPELTAQSEEIASVLREFACASPVAPPEGAADRAWQRLQPALTVLEAPQRKAWLAAWRPKFWQGALAGSLATAALVAGLAVHSLHLSPVAPAAVGATSNAVATTKNWSDGVLSELHMRKAPQQVNHKPGPLTTEPIDVVAQNPALAAHLDNAERVLTEVSHSDGALPDETRAQVHELLLKNAAYHETAEASGDRSTAAVIEDLGRVLITLDAAPHGREEEQDALRVQMNLGGILLDLRILQHNGKAKAGQ